MLCLQVFWRHLLFFPTELMGVMKYSKEKQRKTNFDRSILSLLHACKASGRFQARMSARACVRACVRACWQMYTWGRYHVLSGNASAHVDISDYTFRIVHFTVLGFFGSGL